MKTTIRISPSIRNIQLKVPDDLYKRFKTICVGRRHEYACESYYS